MSLLQANGALQTPDRNAHRLLYGPGTRPSPVAVIFRRVLNQVAPDDIEIGVEMTIEFSQRTLLEPDIAAIRKSKMRRSKANFAAVELGGCLLLIEIAKTRLSYDKGRKASLYAKLGVEEYWVIDANERVTSIHRRPTESSWVSIVEFGASESLSTLALPDFKFKLDDVE